MSIIRGRERLRDVIAGYPLRERNKIEAIIMEEFYRMRHRASPGTRAVHKMPTAKQVLALRALKRKYPEGTDGDLGRKVGIVNHGRSSEVLYGKDGKAVYDRQGERI